MTEPTKNTTLTGNDLACAASACALAIAWWKDSGSMKSKWARDRVKDLKVLSSKLQALEMAAYPHVRYDEDEGSNCDSYGDEPVMKLDEAVVAETSKLGA